MFREILTVNRTNLHFLITVIVPFKIKNQIYEFGAYLVQRLRHKVIKGKDFLANYNGIINLKRGHSTLETDAANLTEKTNHHQYQNKQVRRIYNILITKIYRLQPKSLKTRKYRFVFPTEDDYVLRFQEHKSGDYVLIDYLNAGDAIQSEYRLKKEIIQLDNCLILQTLQTSLHPLKNFKDILTSYSKEVRDASVTPILEAHFVKVIIQQRQLINIQWE